MAAVNKCVSREVLGSLVSVVNDTLTYVDSQAESPFVTFVFVGTQSVGKSALVERLAQNVFNVIKSGRGTKRPLKVYLMKITAEEKPKWRVRDHLKGNAWTELREDEVLTFIETANDSVETISPALIELEVHSCGVSNMQFLDLPGLELNQTEGESADVLEKIMDLIRAFLNKANHFIVVIEKATTQYATSPIIQHLNKQVPTWKQNKNSLLALTFADSLYREDAQKPKAEQVVDRKNDYYHELGLPTFMISNKPCHSNEYAMRKENLQQQDKLESKLIKETFGNAVPSDAEECIGFTKLQSAMEERYIASGLCSFLEAQGRLSNGVQRMKQRHTRLFEQEKLLESDSCTKLPKSLDGADTEWDRLADLRQLLRTKQRALDDTTKELEESDPMELILTFENYFHDQGEEFARLIDNPDHRCLFRPDSDVTGHFGADLPTEFTNHFESDDRLLEVKGVSLPTKKVEAWVTFFKSRLETIEVDGQDSKLIGGSAFERAIRLLFCVLVQRLSDVRNNPTFCKDAVLNAMGAGSSAGSRILQMEPEKARLAICDHVFEELLEPAVAWFLTYCSTLMHRTKKIARHIWMEKDSGDAKRLSNQKAVIGLLDEVDILVLVDVIAKAQERLHDTFGVLGARTIPSLVNHLAPISVFRDQDGILDFLMQILEVSNLPDDAVKKLGAASCVKEVMERLVSNALLKQGWQQFSDPEVLSKLNSTASVQLVMDAIKTSGSEYHQALCFDPNTNTLAPLGKFSLSQGSCSGGTQTPTVKSRAPQCYSFDPPLPERHNLLMRRVQHREVGSHGKYLNHSDEAIIESGFQYVEDMFGLITTYLQLFFCKNVVDEVKATFKHPRVKQRFCEIASKKRCKVLTEELVKDIWNSGRESLIQEKDSLTRDLQKLKEDENKSKDTLLSRNGTFLSKLNEDIKEQERKYHELSQILLQDSGTSDAVQVGKVCEGFSDELRKVTFHSQNGSYRGV